MSQINPLTAVISPDFAQTWLPQVSLAWKLWNALSAKDGQRSSEKSCKAENFVKYIEIDKKFSQMQFIQNSIKHVRHNAKSEQFTHLLEIDQLLLDPDSKCIKNRMMNTKVIGEIQDHGNLLQTFDFFLDNLLCDLGQNSDSVRSYDELLQQDMNSEKIRPSCSEFILRRIHNVLFEKIEVSDWDKAIYKVIVERKNKMQSGRNADNPTKPLYRESEKDLNLYKVSIDMLKQLPKEETPRAKRRLLNQALNLAKHALEVLKKPDPYDDDYLLAYLMYYACTSSGRRRYDFKIFQQLVFMCEFGKESDSNIAEERVKNLFGSLMSKITEDANEQAVKTLTKSSFILF